MSSYSHLVQTQATNYGGGYFNLEARPLMFLLGVNIDISNGRLYFCSCVMHLSLIFTHTRFANLYSNYEINVCNKSKKSGLNVFL